VRAFLALAGVADAKTRKRAPRSLRTVADENPGIFEGLADSVKASLTDASASYVNGVLTVTLPKVRTTEEEDSHHIDVK